MRRHRAASVQTKRAREEILQETLLARSSFSSEALLHARATERKIGSSNIGQLRDRTQQRLRQERKDPGGGERERSAVAARFPIRILSRFHSEAAIKDKPVSDRVDRAHRAFRNPEVFPPLLPPPRLAFRTPPLSSRYALADRAMGLHRILPLI